MFEEDFPERELEPTIGHDGQQFYVIARSPFDREVLEDQLDRPRYRLQRPLFPAAARVLYPPGAGTGLVLAFAVIGAAALVGLGLAAGHLSLALGGETWPAAIAPVLPGSYAAFRLGLADNLALALTLACLLALERRRTRLAVLAAVCAVLTKEFMIVVLVGRAALLRTRASMIVAGVAGAVAAAWWGLLRLLISESDRDVVELGVPFAGLVDSIEFWSRPSDLVSAASVGVGIILVVSALLLRSSGHHLFGPVLLLAAFSSLFTIDVIAPDHNGPRTLGPLILLSILMLGTPPRSGLSERLHAARPPVGDT